MAGINWVLVLSIALGVSEVLGMIPGIKSNGIFQLVYNLLKSLAPKDQAQIK